jgi:pyruvate/2-oxoglutarate dehydrogenase complex dihydrolipoamide acyltransferase (E2) component
MSTEVLMPQMGESIFEGTVTKWLKKTGDKVDRDEPLFEISTDKVDAEIPSPTAGVLKEIKVQEGETVEINTVVAVLDGGNGASISTSAEAPVAEEEPKTEAAKPVAATPPPPAPSPATARAPVNGGDLTFDSKKLRELGIRTSPFSPGSQDCRGAWHRPARPARHRSGRKNHKTRCAERRARRGAGWCANPPSRAHGRAA